MDSATSANDGPVGNTLYDKLIRPDQAGRKPAYWGRYIGSPVTARNLTFGEVQFLHDLNIRIFLIYSGATQAQVEEPIPTIARQNGVDAANAAIARASALEVPGGIPGGAQKVWIYCNIEFGWNPTAEFFRGWFITMFNSPYGGGVYIATQHPAHRDPYCEAYNSLPAEMQNSRALLFTNQRLKCSGHNPVPPIPNCAALGPTYWAKNPPAFAEAVIPPCGAPVAIYQYAMDLTISGQTRAVDYDLANRVGFERMWVPSKAWEAVNVHDGISPFVEGILSRCVESMPAGRIYIVWIGVAVGEPNRHFFIRSSDDSGETWQIHPRLTNVASTLQSGFEAGIVERNGLLDVYWNWQGESLPNRQKIWRSSFDGTSWLGFRTEMHDTGGDQPRDLKSARSRDRSARSIFFTLGAGAGPLRWLPVNNDGTPGTVETVSVAFGGFGAPNLFYDENNRPVVVMFSTSKWRRKVRDPVAGWPAAWEEFDTTDPITTREELVFRPISDPDGFPLKALGTFAVEDAHGLLTPGSQSSSLVHTYRHLIDGVWGEEEVDFRALDRPVTGGNADEFVSTQLAMFTDFATPLVMGVLLAEDLTNPASRSVWFIRRLAKNL